MSRNGSGIYSLVAGNPVITGTVVSSTWANNTLSDIATALTGSLAADGQTTPTANLPMGGFKFTGLAAGSAAGNSARYEQLGMIPLASGSVSAAASLAITANIDATYDVYRLEIYGFEPVTDGQLLLLQVSTDGGANYKSGASDYVYAINSATSASANSPLGSGGDIALVLTLGQSNAQTMGVNGTIEFCLPSGIGAKAFKWQMFNSNSSATYFSTTGGGAYVGSATAINALRLKFLSGNIAAGNWILYGMRK